MHSSFEGCPNQSQPPSGGCVLKQDNRDNFVHTNYPAAFRRLCVETSLKVALNLSVNPAAFRRLCVETFALFKHRMEEAPAAFRRLCVETFALFKHRMEEAPAAFRRLCVETVYANVAKLPGVTQPPSGGCVLKHLPDDWLYKLVGPAAFRRLCVETLISRYYRR